LVARRRRNIFGERYAASEGEGDEQKSESYL
jgi:hypothetical protein